MEHAVHLPGLIRAVNEAVAVIVPGRVGARGSRGHSHPAVHQHLLGSFETCQLPQKLWCFFVPE